METFLVDCHWHSKGYMISNFGGSCLVLTQVVMAQQLAIIKRPKYCQLAMVWLVLILAPTLLDTKQTLSTPSADSNGKKTHNLQSLLTISSTLVDSD
jgi:hypothetical protein